MRQALVVGNWKMNGSLSANQELLSALIQADKGLAQCAVCPSAIHLPAVAQQLQGSEITWGLQDVSAQAQGAYTGEISTGMAQEFGCTYVIVGHSERRTLWAESSAQVAEKAVAAAKAGLTPILCVGETLEQRESQSTLAVISEQLQALFAVMGSTPLSLVVAYEPVWAIGTGLTASPEQAQEVHAFIREKLCEVNQSLANETRILYGGSVKSANAEELFAKPDIDGGLVGGASLDAQEFATICRLAG